MPIRSFCRSSGRTVSHVVFSTLFSFTLFRALSSLIRLLSLSLPIFVCGRFLDSLVFVVASVFDRHTLSRTHIYSISVSHSIAQSLASSSLSSFCSCCSRFSEAFASLLTLNSILSEGSSSILFNHQNDLWDFYTQKYTFKNKLIKRNGK